MKKTNWPTWAPVQAIEYYDSTQKLGGADKLYLLLTHNRASPIWAKLQKYNIDCEQFCDSFLEALAWPVSDKSPAEYQKHLDRIAEKALELAMLIEEVPNLNGTFSDEYDEKWFRKNLHKEIDWNSDFYRYRPRSFFDELLHIRNLATQHTEKAIYERPNTKNADTIFFIKSMTGFFREETGRPHTEIILLCVELLFPDYPISKKAIEKITARKINPP